MAQNSRDRSKCHLLRFAPAQNFKVVLVKYMLPLYNTQTTHIPVCAKSGLLATTWQLAHNILNMFFFGTDRKEMALASISYILHLVHKIRDEKCQPPGVVQVRRGSSDRYFWW